MLFILIMLLYLSISLGVYSVYMTEDEYIQEQTIEKGIKYSVFWPYYFTKYTVKYTVKYIINFFKTFE